MPERLRSSYRRTRASLAVVTQELRALSASSSRAESVDLDFGVEDAYPAADGGAPTANPMLATGDGLARAPVADQRRHAALAWRLAERNATLRASLTPRTARRAPPLADVRVPAPKFPLSRDDADRVSAAIAALNAEYAAIKRTRHDVHRRDPPPAAPPRRFPKVRRATTEETTLPPRRAASGPFGVS